jgi:Na+/proline symporter
MENNRNNNIEDILNSLDGSQRAAVPNFFYTRLKARMEKGIEVKTKRSWMLRPVYVVVGLFLILILNTVVFLKNSNAETTITDENDVSQQSIAAEYNLNEMTYVYDLNQDR